MKEMKLHQKAAEWTVCKIGRASKGYSIPKLVIRHVRPEMELMFSSANASFSVPFFFPFDWNLQFSFFVE